jgi:ribosomal protein S12 methylthiotransferase
MLVQQRIAFEKNKAKVGKNLTAMIDGASTEPPGYLVGRSQSEAPEVDGAILVKGNDAKAGELVEVKIVGYRDYDLIGEQLRGA